MRRRAWIVSFLMPLLGRVDEVKQLFWRIE
jgi:hypothetical protein